MEYSCLDGLCRRSLNYRRLYTVSTLLYTSSTYKTGSARVGHLQPSVLEVTGSGASESGPYTDTC